MYFCLFSSFRRRSNFNERQMCNYDVLEIIFGYEFRLRQRREKEKLFHRIEFNELQLKLELN